METAIFWIEFSLLTFWRHSKTSSVYINIVDAPISLIYKSFFFLFLGVGIITALWFFLFIDSHLFLKKKKKKKFFPFFFSSSSISYPGIASFSTIRRRRIFFLFFFFLLLAFFLFHMEEKKGPSSPYWNDAKIPETFSFFLYHRVEQRIRVYLSGPLGVYTTIFFFLLVYSPNTECVCV